MRFVYRAISNRLKIRGESLARGAVTREADYRSRSEPEIRIEE
jgi:hypothetical protein